MGKEVREIPDRKSPWQEDLTERELVLMEALTEEPSTMTEIIGRLGISGDFKVREVLVDQYTKLEGKGLVRRMWPRGDRPSTWAITFRGRRVG